MVGDGWATGYRLANGFISFQQRLFPPNDLREGGSAYPDFHRVFKVGRGHGLEVRDLLLHVPLNLLPILWVAEGWIRSDGGKALIPVI